MSMREKETFKSDGTLKTRLVFRGVIVPETWTKQQKTVLRKGKEVVEVYFTLVDRYGARFLIYNEALIKSFEIDKAIEINGRIGISRGGTYLVIESTHDFFPQSYRAT